MSMTAAAVVAENDDNNNRKPDHYEFGSDTNSSTDDSTGGGVVVVAATAADGETAKAIETDAVLLPSSFCNGGGFKLLLALLPPELLQQILVYHCDGKSISTLMHVLLCCRSTMKTDPAYTEFVTKTLPTVCQLKLINIASIIEGSGIRRRDNKNKNDDHNNDDKNNNNDGDDDHHHNDPDRSELNGAAAWIRNVARSCQEQASCDRTECHKTCKSSSSMCPKFTTNDTCGCSDGRNNITTLSKSMIRVLSENMAVYDFMVSSFNHYSNVRKGQIEWPVWVGRINVSAFVTGSRLTHDARVVLTSPISYPTTQSIPGYHLVSHRHTPYGKFRCEPYNIVPLPPWGRIRPLQDDDARALKPVAQRLQQLGQVAVPHTYHGFHHSNQDLLDIRIITKTQAIRLQRSRTWRPRTSWILQNEQDENGNDINDDDDIGDKTTNNQTLLCCWQDDSTTEALENDRDYVQYILDLVRAQKRLENTTDDPYHQPHSFCEYLPNHSPS